MNIDKISRVVTHLAGPGIVGRVSPNGANPRHSWIPYLGAFVTVRDGKTLPPEADVIAHETVYDTFLSAVKAMQTWQTAMADTDATMTRQSEDVIGTMTPTQFDKLPQYIQDAYAAKVTLRGEKP